MQLIKLLTGFGLALSVFLASCGPGKQDTMFKQVPSSRSGVVFNNVIEENDTFNIMDEQYLYNGGGVGLGDFNQDGLLDIYFAGNFEANKLYLNKGDFVFEDVTEAARVAAPDIWSSGVTVVDINNDGRLDIYVSATFRKDAPERTNKLFVNMGNDENGIPVFEDQAEKYGIADDGYSTHAVFFDYDLDGDLDLYVLTDVLTARDPTQLFGKIADGSSPTNDRFYRNNGDGTFTDVTREAGILLEGYGLGIAVLDINRDGYPDLYISNDFITNDVLWVNNGDGTFTNRIGEYFKHQSHSSMGNDASDINNDGYPDIMTLDMLPASNQREKQMFGAANYNFQTLSTQIDYEIQYTRNCLHLHNGPLPGSTNGTAAFSDVALLAGVHNTDWSWSVLFADYDNDGLKDIFITNGFPRDVTDLDFSDYRMTPHRMFDSKQKMLDQIPVVKIRNYLFQNQGDLRFDDVSEDWGFGLPSFSNGAAFGDLDNDGDLDLIVNNINDEAFIYENTARQKSPEYNYLRLQFRGNPGNIDGIGAKVWLKYNGRTEFYEYYPYRGYTSSVEPALHFGLGAAGKIDSLVVQWYDGRRQILRDVRPNQTIKLDYKDSARLPVSFIDQPPPAPIFRESGQELLLRFQHFEHPFMDHRVQILVPHGLANEGPGIAVGDVNGDGLEDCFFGNGRGQPGMFFIQQPSGTFTASPLDDDRLNEYQGVLLFDADGDGDLDLYVASGSSEFEAYSRHFKDLLFFNDGKGGFILDTTALPQLQITSSTVNAADFDRDGDLDLFVGGRMIPQSYPLPERSAVLRNDNGKFTDVTEEVCPELMQAGMVTAALWTDFDNDGWVDLIIAGEWMPIRFFKNEKGILKEITSSTGLGNTGGWWRSLVAGDFDGDGDVDYVAGNQGINNRYRASLDHPLRVVAKDFDHNGSVDLVISAYREGDYYPVHLRNDMIAQMNFLKKRYLKYAEYGRAKTSDLFSGEQLEGAYHAEVHMFESIFIENKGNGKFEYRPLPVEAQVGPLAGMLVDDFNSDGRLDILAVGNNFYTEVFGGRHDAHIGLLLAGDGKGGFRPVPVSESGFYVPDNGKSLVQLFLGDDRPVVLAAQNAGSSKAFAYSWTYPTRIIEPLTTDAKAILHCRDGRQIVRELYYGSSYLSGSSRKFAVSQEEVAFVELIDFLGNVRKIEVQPVQ
jgi:enediyne biosynthesis protein E4